MGAVIRMGSRTVDVNYYLNGDCGITIAFRQEIDPQINMQVHHLKTRIENVSIEGLVDLIPGYSSLLVCYNPLIIGYDALVNQLEKLLESLQEKEIEKGRVIKIPVCYGGEYGQDIETVAKSNGISVEDVINLHSSSLYRIYMIGFKPGFPYLGGLPKELATPRLEKPRLKVKKGSVGIAGNQTGIYPQDSPGGWQIIGHTPLILVDWSKEDLTLFKPGDYIEFYSVDEEQYKKIEEDVSAGTYSVEYLDTKEGAE